MPAVVRGGSRPQAGSRPKASQSSGARSRGGARGPAYSPAKLKAARGVGLRPGLALAVAVGVAVIGLVAALATGDRLARASTGVRHGVAVRMAKLGFWVDAVHVEGASPQASADILRAVAVPRRSPILDVDLGAVRERVETVGWVKNARVVRLLPDELVVSISERKPTAVWQHHGRSLVIDATGHAIGEADPMRYADLPLVVGEGANNSADEILALVRARPRLMDRLEALVRVDDRRWDIRLKDGGLIQLPARGEESALIQLDQMDQKARVLELGFERIDLRDPDVVAVRPREAPPAVAQSAPTAGA